MGTRRIEREERQRIRRMAAAERREIEAFAAARTALARAAARPGSAAGARREVPEVGLVHLRAA